MRWVVVAALLVSCGVGLADEAPTDTTPLSLDREVAQPADSSIVDDAPVVLIEDEAPPSRIRLRPVTQPMRQHPPEPLPAEDAIDKYWDDLIRDRAIWFGPFAPLLDELQKKHDPYKQWLSKNNHLAAQKDLDGLWLLSGAQKGDTDVVVEIRGPLLREFKVDWQLVRRADERFPIKKAHEIDEGEIGWLTTEPVQKFRFRFQSGVIYEITPLKVGILGQRRLILDSFRGNGKQAMKNRDLLPF